MDQLKKLSGGRIDGRFNCLTMTANKLYRGQFDGRFENQERTFSIRNTTVILKGNNLIYKLYMYNTTSIDIP